MSCIFDFQKKYCSKISSLDLELILSAIIKKPREFVLAHPEYTLTNSQISNIKSQIAQRIKGRPMAYILGHKEFFGLDFAVNKYTLVPRPETELLVENVLRKIPDTCLAGRQNTIIADIGTGSGNIIISVAKNLKNNSKYKYFGLDVSKKALQIAKQNAKRHNLDKKIKFLHGNLLEPFKKNKLPNKFSSFIIIANLPYLSKKIYNSAPNDVKKYEPRSALFSKKDGLSHYERLLGQIVSLKNDCCMLKCLPAGRQTTCYMEISPEQKTKMTGLVRKYFPKIKPIFHKDLAQKWRLCELKIS
jgi:release factor glutamine methyltransferase